MTQIHSEKFFSHQPFRQSPTLSQQKPGHQSRSFGEYLNRQAGPGTQKEEAQNHSQRAADVSLKQQVGGLPFHESESAAAHVALNHLRETALQGKGQSTRVENLYQTGQTESEIEEALASEDFNAHSIGRDIDVLSTLFHRGDEEMNTGNFIHQLVATGQFDTIQVSEKNSDSLFPSMNGETDLNRSDHRVSGLSTGFQSHATSGYFERLSGETTASAERVFWRGKIQHSARPAVQNESVMDAYQARNPAFSEDFTKTLLKTFIEPDKIRVCFRDYAGQTHKEALMKLIQALHVQSDGPVFLTYNGVTEVHYGDTTRG